MRATIDSKGEVEFTYNERPELLNACNIPEKEVPKVDLEEFRDE